MNIVLSPFCSSTPVALPSQQISPQSLYRADYRVLKKKKQSDQLPGMDDEDGESGEKPEDVPFRAPFKTGRAPLPSSSSTDASSGPPLPSHLKEIRSKRREFRARTRAAAQATENNDNLPLKVFS